MKTIESSVTFYELSAYNAGILKPFTIDLEYIESESELNDAISEQLELIGENCEEVIICSTDNIPYQYVNEWSIDSEYFDYKEVVIGSSYDEEVFLAGIECGIVLEDIEEAYQGHYSNDEDFACSLADDIGAVDNNASWPMNCINWELAARELMFDYCNHGGHYFRHL